MACPFFDPQRTLDPGAWTHRPRLPLGDPHFGFCHASGSSFPPAEEHQRELCNRGYARGLCPHFPDAGAADAVRFSVTEDAGGRLRVVYVLEKDHGPLRHGALEFGALGFEALELGAAESSSGPTAPGVDDLLLRQARAFVGSYLKTRDLYP